MESARSVRTRKSEPKKCHFPKNDPVIDGNSSERDCARTAKAIMDNLLDESGIKERDAEHQASNPLEIALKRVQTLTSQTNEELAFFETFKAKKKKI